MKASVCEKTIAYGKNRFRTDGKNWAVLMFGVYGPSCNGIPSYRFVNIPESKVPDEVKRKAQN